jgi:RNA polymerase sigma-70 factor (ECF subfamily)
VEQLDPEGLFNRVYDEHSRAVHAFFVGRTGDPEAALELLQETFIRAWRHLDALRGLPADRQSYWVFAVAKNELTDHYRKAAARKEACRSYALEPCPSASPGSSLGEDLERREEVRLLYAAIRHLPENLREVLALQILGGMTSGQIGEALGRPAGTVRYQLSLARRRLANQVRLIESDGDDRHERRIGG